MENWVTFECVALQIPLEAIIDLSYHWNGRHLLGKRRSLGLKEKLPYLGIIQTVAAIIQKTPTFEATGKREQSGGVEP